MNTRTRGNSGTPGPGTPGIKFQLGKMSRRPQAHLLLFIALAVRCLAALELPYEVLDSIIELSDLDTDFIDLNRGPTRPIYRLDLDPDYVAYYEIDIGSDYVVLSNGRKTGDYRKVESGPDPRPTNVLIQQAQNNGQRCEKFLSTVTIGMTVCMNDNGTAVAASYNWTADVAQAVEVRLEQHRRCFKGGERKETDVDEEALSPGSIVKVALGERFKSVDVYITSSGNSRLRPSSRSNWQQKLCQVLVDVCHPNGTTKVNPSAIKETPNHLLYLKLEVHGNRAFVGNVLEWREIGFVVEIKERKEVIKKHFAIDLHSNRFRRSVILGEVSAEKNNFPDYDQHKCCGSCYSGCGPVAWAQIFGYYDRKAATPNSIFSSTIYGDSSTKAPLHLTDEVKRFVEDIRLQVKTFCNNGQGSTYTSNMHLIAPWFRPRQGSNSRVVSYLESRKKRSSDGSSVVRGGRSWIQSKAAEYIKSGYPVILDFDFESEGGHSAVATRYKGTSRRNRHCKTKTTGWWVGKKTKTVCSWETAAYDYEFFLHYGWGGRNNKWQQVSPFGAHVAYIA
ncbi:hypothetical protein OS493_010995 [Desmophyllum pertusum]|uniref:Uncharacterized protein n=1 Tax=Desmophyllum pertusum TaxID=174260 RepID=A0A9X0D0G2_9CNID|nr:hypothetical protein OS493_010995 [Desmophyllum pertusum]